jgi:hypothetical protein
MKEQQQIEIPSISSTHFTLFHASKACQTEIDEIQDTKELAQQLNGLYREIHDSVKALQSAYSAQVSRLTAGIIERLEIKNIAMKKSYTNSITRLDQVNRTELANGIAKLWRQYERKYEHDAIKIRSEHSQKICALEESIKEYQRKRLSNESSIRKNKIELDQCSKIAKRAGYDLEGQLNQDKVSLSQIDALENLQKSLAEKDALLSSLKIQYQNEVEKQAEEKRIKTAQIRKQLRLSSKKMMKVVSRRHSINPRGSFITRQSSKQQMIGDPIKSGSEQQPLEEPIIECDEMVSENSETIPDFFLGDLDLPVIYANDGPQNIEKTLAEMENEFEKEREDELKMTKELEEEFRRDYTLVRAQAIKTKGWCLSFR